MRGPSVCAVALFCVATSATDVATAFTPKQARKCLNSEGMCPAASSLSLCPSRAHSSARGLATALPRGGHSESTSALSAIPSVGTAASAVNNFYQTMPMLAAFITCGIKASAADYIAQKRSRSEEEEPEFDGRLELEEPKRRWSFRRAIGIDGGGSGVKTSVPKQPSIHYQRNAAFLLYGGLYQGMAQEHIYNHIFPVLFGDSGPASVLAKVFFDMLVLTPFLCLPIAYVVKSFIFRHSLGEAVDKYANDVKNKGLLIKYWSIWGPVQCLTFGVVPEHLRITFIACVSFFWLIIFSTISSSNTEDDVSVQSAKAQPEKA